MPSLRIAIDITQLERDYRGMGFFLREFLFHLSQSNLQQFEFFLVVKRKENLLENFPYPVTTPKEAPQFSLVWFPFNHPTFKPKGPYVITLHDLAPFVFSHGEKALQKKFFEGAKSAKKVVVDSKFILEEAKKHFPSCKEKMVQIYPGFRSHWPPPKAFPIEWPYLLAIGPAEPRKNFERLLMAFARLKRQNFPHKLVVVGELPPRRKKVGFFWVERKNPLPSLAKKLRISQDVIFPGIVSRDILARWYEHASLLVVPSLYEGFGFPVLEAYSFGIPVACSYAGSLPEVAGDGAFFFNPHNSDEMSAVLYHALTDKKAVQQKKVLASTQLKQFSWEVCIQNYLKLFESASKS